MARRRLTVKRLDPWSVLKFGAVANLALLAIGLLVAAVAWFIVDRLGLVDQVCSIALDVGFTACGINAGNLFRALVLLGLLGAVVQTAVLVFLSFLHNLIADLTGGLALTVIDDSPSVAPRAGAGSATATSGAGAGAGFTTGGSRPVTATSPPARESASGSRSTVDQPTQAHAPVDGRSQAPARDARTSAPPVPPLGRDARGEGASRANPDPRGGTEDDLFGGR